MNSADAPIPQGRSVTRLIERLKNKDSQAPREIWQRFFERLLPLARARLQALPDRTVDEEDILVSVFDRFFRAAREERFAQLNDRDDLWQILLMLTDRGVAQQYRRSQAQKRGGGDVRLLGDLAEADSRPCDTPDQEPGPEFVAAFNDHLSRALARLSDERTREVALLKLEGYENREIAQRLEISLSSVERKLRVIRQSWREEFGKAITSSKEEGTGEL
jgi:DNA-directed RNA polymerase specialized sigma24 family protein